MNKLFLFIFACSLIFVPFQSQAKIVETYNFGDIEAEVHENTIVFFDIDDTLINTKSMLGNTAWWRYFVAKSKKVDLSHGNARSKINAIIQKIIVKVPMDLVDPYAADMVRKIQSKGIHVFGLTARCISPDYMPEADLGTHEHLQSVGIDFTLTPPPKYIDDSTARFFSYGIIFTNYQKKGPYLKAFLNNLDFKPEKIVFIDDCPEQVKSVEKAAEEMGISFSGFRYGKLDYFHEKFDPLVANIQLEQLIKNDRILSDEEALEIAKDNPGRSPDYFIDELIRE